MEYGCCTICERPITEGIDLVITGITITGGYGLADENRTSKARYTHQNCHTKPRPNHARDAIEACQ